MPPFAAVHVVTNPGSGGGGGLPEAIVEALDAACPGWTRHDCAPDAGPDVLARRALAARADLVVAHGGDGTVRAVADALAGTDAVMAVLPAGTANVFAAELGLTGGVPGAAALVTGAAPSAVRRVDIGRATAEGRGEASDGEHPFLLRIGLGLQAAMVTNVRTEDKRRWGRLAYVRQFAVDWRRLSPHRYTVSVDGGRPERTAGVSCLVCNTTSAGMPGLTFLDDADDASDGRLDVVVARRLGAHALGLALWHGVQGLARGRGFSIRPSPEIRVWSGARVRVAVEPAQEAACDGEALGHVSLVEARVHAATLRVLVPATAPTGGPARVAGA